MATHKPAPLRDRLLSNSPDPIKTSILRESGMGWASSATSSSNAGSITSPLRIAKRDSPAVQRGADVARRSSSSFKHVRNNNLVSKSPFKTQIPTPSTPSRPTSVLFPTRRVSGEKRPRPSSMHEDAENENDRPFSLKRDRKQSKTFQGLLEREPVTKSPFKRQERMKSVDEVVLPSQSPAVSKIPLPAHAGPIPTISSHLAPTNLDPSAPSKGLSPGRSSLVSRRLHGPRLSGTGRRGRRKRVTFDERCDVVEFDRETSEEEVFDDTDGEDGELYQDAEEGDPFFRSEQSGHESLPLGSHPPQGVHREDDSYESIQLSDTDRSTTATTLLDPDTSITGLVEEMFFSSNAALISADVLGSSTPPRASDIPTDLETEDGVPFGRSHHAERLLQHHQQESPQLSQPPPHFSPRHSPYLSQPPSQRQSPQTNSTLPYPFNLGLPTRASPNGPPATPPRPSPRLAQSTPPLGRSTHMERTLKARGEERDEVQTISANVEKLPASPSPMKVSGSPLAREGLIPKFKWPRGTRGADHISPSTGSDPFGEHLTNEPSFEEHPKSSNDSLDPGNLSIGNSEVSLSGLERGDVYHSDAEVPAESELENSSFLRNDSQHENSCSYIADTSREVGEVLASITKDSQRISSEPLSHSTPPSCATSPVLHTTSPSVGASQSSNNGSRMHSPHPTIRQRISKEDIRRRLTERRSIVSPSPEPPSRRSDPTTRQEEPLPVSDIPVEGVSQDGDAEIPHHAEPHPESSDCDKERDRMSIMTALTDISTEPATIQRAEKFNMAAGLPAQDRAADKEFGVLNTGPNLQLNFGSKFSLGGLGFSRGDSSTRSRDSLGILKRDIEVNAGNVKLGDVDVNVDMKSALDRLMDDMAGGGGCGDDSIMTEEDEISYDQSMEPRKSNGVQRAATDTAFMQINGTMNRTISSSSTSSIPPPVPPKDNIKAREQLILEKRREARRAEEGDFLPTRARAHQIQSQLGLGRPSRRRSMSTGDAQDLGRRRIDGILNVGDLEEDPLSNSIERELRKLGDEMVSPKSKYHIREHEGTIYASASEDKVSHMAGAGDVDTGKAWRTVRRPSDMNEYSKQIKAYRSQANPGKAYGKVFVKVLGIKGVHLPLPQQPTALTCTLNNGIHFVTTPECDLGPDCRIDQEFELIEHSKLEFTLTLKIRRDPHIIAQFKALVPAPAPAPPPPPPPLVQQSSSRGVRAFFSSSPKKASKEKVVQPPPPPPVHRLPENLARYLKADGTFARAFIQFKDIATRCDTRLFETSYPLIGQRVELGGKFSTLQVGEIILQMFRLPPLPGIPPDQLPQSLDECHRGLRHINWHKMTYFQGTLTQNGGDCSTWRRRHFRVIGASLVAFNDVTKKATATIDLKKALAVQDDQDMRNPLSPLARSRGYDEDALFGVERSFRLVFPQEQEIIFFADTDEEKCRWLEVLRALVGHIPPHPLWAELLWQHQESSKPPPNPTNNNSSESAQQDGGRATRR